MPTVQAVGGGRLGAPPGLFVCSSVRAHQSVSSATYNPDIVVLVINYTTAWDILLCCNNRLQVSNVMSANPFKDWLAFSSDAPVDDSYLPPSSPLPFTPSSIDDDDDNRSETLETDPLTPESQLDILEDPFYYFSGEDRPEGDKNDGASYLLISTMCGVQRHMYHGRECTSS